YTGTDSFTYEVCDTTGACDSATVTVTVTAVNDEDPQAGSADGTEGGPAPTSAPLAGTGTLAFTGASGVTFMAAGLGLVCLLAGTVLMVRRRRRTA
ncbi:Ig-like domain-containing protein, partial [Arthrobacter sp. NPDC093125]|uniref:Ig-like domain-containing protein n=1 Tax=Arthrobacter sp. NPDC093125 TaxID=3363944 RepID=UPI0038226D06